MKRLITFADATPEQIRAYAEQVKAAGFDVNPETEDMEMQGMLIYTYSTQNAAGYSISVFSAAGTMGLAMQKP